MLHLLTDELLEGVPEYIRRCRGLSATSHAESDAYTWCSAGQTWEGGIAGEEGLEAWTSQLS